jgi:hypothetical protein
MNGFIIFIITMSYLITHLPVFLFTNDNIQKRKCYNHPLSLHHIFFFIWILTNFILAFGVSCDILSLSPLGLTSSLVCIYFISSMKISIKLTLVCLVCSVPALLPITPLSPNYEKLCYLTAWQSAQAFTARLWKFFSEGAICIDSGASCCISNKKADFLTFAPSTSTILQGISSGLKIAGTGTLKWTILNDGGNEITIRLCNSLHVLDTPMCLLSPQHLAQQTTSTSDGFHSKGNCGN